MAMQSNPTIAVAAPVPIITMPPTSGPIEAGRISTSISGPTSPGTMKVCGSSS